MVTQRLTRGRSGGINCSVRNCWPHSAVKPVVGSLSHGPVNGELDSGVPGLVSKILVLSEQVCKQHVSEVTAMQKEITKLRYQLEQTNSELGKFKSGTSHCRGISQCCTAREPGPAWACKTGSATGFRRNSAPAIMADHGCRSSLGPATSSIHAASDNLQPTAMDFPPRMVVGLRNAVATYEEQMGHVTVNDERSRFCTQPQEERNNGFAQSNSIAKVVHFLRRQEREAYLAEIKDDALGWAANTYIDNNANAAGFVGGAAWRSLSERQASRAASEGILREHSSSSSRTESPPPCVAVESAVGEVAVRFRAVRKPSSAQGEVPKNPLIKPLNMKPLHQVPTMNISPLKLSPLGCHRAQTSGQITQLETRFQPSCISTPRSYTPRQLSSTSSLVRSPKEITTLRQQRQNSRQAYQDIQAQIQSREPLSARTLSGRTLSTRTLLTSRTKDSETPEMRASCGIEQDDLTFTL
mmetsp:Transcript_7697/g.14209  ORF Transcript_7697/g.14209 Transcript_7697/m.14209 type:complete len:469 (+) Transcript_7697:160-1566(+)